MDAEMTGDHNNKGKAPAAENTSPPRALTLDVALYESYLENTDMTEDERRVFLEALWSVIVGFVDLGFEIHPLQLACGQNDETRSIKPADLVKLADRFTGQTLQIVGDDREYHQRDGKET